MPSETAHRLSIYVAALGAVLTLGVAATWGPAPAVSTAIGAVMGLINWYLLKWIVARLVAGEVREQARFMAVVLLKMGAFMLTAYGLLALGLVSPLPFIVGLGALAGGLLLGSFQYILFGKSDVAGHGPVGSEH